MGSTFGLGASTNHFKDYQNARLFLVEGNNPAENHPMAMKWMIRALEKGAKLVVVDPRFTRTAAHADLHLTIRPGTDIAFQGGLIRWILDEGAFDAEYLKAHTNADFLLDPNFHFDPEAGLFEGFHHDREGNPRYETDSWVYQLDEAGEPKRGEDLLSPGTVLWHLWRHFRRYTPDLVESITGIPAPRIEEVGRLVTENRPGVVMYALGATQHTIGVQQIRCYAILQLLLGNVGKPGGGVGANRGESNVQGATDMAVLWDKLPGYLPIPGEWEHELGDYQKAKGVDAAKGLKNLLRAWFDRELSLEEAYRCLPRAGKKKGFSIYELQDRMRTREVKGLVVMGMNPVVSHADRAKTLASFAHLELLVVLDLFETETARFFEAFGPDEVRTEVFVLPAASFLEKPGSLTNSGRWVQAREKVVEPSGKSKPDLWILDQLAQRLKARVKDSRRPRDRALVSLRWDHGSDYQKVLQEIAGEALEELSQDGVTLASGEPLPSSAWLQDDGRTSCGNRLYAGLFAGGRDLSQRRDQPAWEADEQSAHPGWAWSWPDNQRILYDLEGPKPFSRTAEGVARLFAAKRELRSPEGALVRSSMVPVDGPLPEHFEPIEGPFSNPLHPKQKTSPMVVHPRNPEEDVLGSDEDYPHILTTGFLHEMWGGGAMTRRLKVLAETQPGPFLEMSRGLANRLGIRDGRLVKLSTARGAVELPVLVTGRLKPVYCDGAFHEILFAPMHYGEQGLVKGPSINDLTLDALEPNVKIQETKACRCKIEVLPPTDRFSV